MTKAFTLWLWENLPSINTPLGKSRLDLLNVALNEIDNRVVKHDTTKANQSDMLTAITSVSFDKSTGIFTFTKKNGATTKIDTLLEKLAINFTYDKTNQRLVITNSDGTIQYVDLKALITELEFLNSNTVLFSVSDGKVTANIAKGSITDDMIEANYLANVKLYASNALSYANTAKGYMDTAKSYRDTASTYATNAKGSADLAKGFMESANEALETVNQKLELATFDLDDDGNLIYTDTSSYSFSVDNDGMLNYSVS